MIISRLKEMLVRRRKGTVALLAVASMIPVTAMLAANMNTGQMVDDRRQVQDASDALATMHATWTARSLNVISMNNVTTAQLLTVAVGSETLEGTMQEIEVFAALALAHIGTHAAINCTPTGVVDAIVWTPFCLLQHADVSIPALQAIKGTSLFIPFPLNLKHRPQRGVYNIRKDFDPKHGVRVSHKALRAIEGMNRAIVSRFPRAMAEMGSEYARVHGIDDFHFADPCNGYGTENCTASNTNTGMALPLEKGGAASRLEMCLAMETGTTAKFTSFVARGFSRGKGPLAFGGSSQHPHIRDHILRTTRVGSVLRRFKRFYKSSRSKTVRRNNPFPSDRHPQVANLWGEQNRYTSNSFTRRFFLKMASLCINGGTINVPTIVTNLQLEAPVPTMWKLKDIPLVDLPKVQPDQMPDAFRILAFTEMEKSRRLASQVFGDGVQSHFGYAQVGLYNPDGADLFSANWRFRMMPATRMDKPQQVASDLRTQAHGSFRPLADSFGAVTDMASWGRINAH